MKSVFLLLFFITVLLLVPLQKIQGGVGGGGWQSNLTVKQWIQVNLNTETDFTVKRQSKNTTGLFSQSLYTKPTLVGSQPCLIFLQEPVFSTFSQTWAKQLNRSGAVIITHKDKVSIFQKVSLLRKEMKPELRLCSLKQTKNITRPLFTQPIQTALCM